MKTLKKCIAFMLAAGLMVSAMTVFADEGDVSNELYYSSTPTQDPNRGNIYDTGNGVQYQGTEKPDATNTPEGYHPQEGYTWFDKANNKIFNYVNGEWIPSKNDGPCNTSSDSGSSSGESSPLSPEDIAAIESRAESAAVQGAASDEGFADVGDMYRAAEKGMSAGEYYNNAVVSTPGIENAITVGQGGNLVVNGVITNMSATITKVTNRAYVDSVRIEQEGRVLNVVDVSYPAVEATINFYTPGITDGMEIVALQYNAGTWVNVEVAEVRADHVVLNMKGNGVVAFIAK